jgi:hypothetical protein
MLARNCCGGGWSDVAVVGLVQRPIFALPAGDAAPVAAPELRAFVRLVAVVDYAAALGAKVPKRATIASRLFSTEGLRLLLRAP